MVILETCKKFPKMMNASVVGRQIKYAQLIPAIVMKMKSVTLSSTFLSAQGVFSVISGWHSRKQKTVCKKWHH